MTIEPPTASQHPVCCHCGQPVLPGHPRWAGDPDLRPWHYACAEASGLTERVTRGVAFRAGKSGDPAS